MNSKSNQLRYETILNSLNEYIRVVDRHNNVVFENRPMQRFFGKTTGRKCYELWNQDSPCDHCAATDARHDSKAKIQEKKSNNRFYSVKCYPILLADGTCDEIVEIISDVTEQKKLNEKLENYTEKLKEAVDRKTLQIRKNQEIILQERTNLINILDSMQDLVFVINPACKIRFINKIARQKYGNVLNDECYRVIRGRSQKCPSCHKTHLLKKNETRRWEHFAENENRFYDILESPTIGPDRNAATLIIMRDITEIKTMELQLRNSEERYALAQDAANLGSWDLHLADKTLHWSDKIEPIFGFKKGEFKGTYNAFLECVYPDDRIMVVDAVNSCITGTGDYSVEHRIVWPNGKVRWVSETGNIVKDDQGHAVRLVGVVTDITIRKQYEEKLHLNEARLEALLKLKNMTESSDDDISSFALEKGVSLTNSQIGYMHFINDDQKTLNLYSWSRETLKNCTAAKLSHYPIDKAGIWVDCVRQKRPVIHNDYQKYNGKKGYPEGHVHLVRHMSIPVFENDKVVAVAGVGNKPTNYDSSDVRQLSLLMKGMWGHIRHRRNVEKIKKHSSTLEDRVRELVEEVRVKDKLAILGGISSGLAHEIRNPMGSIIAGIKLLSREDKSPEDKKTVLDILTKESERINRALTGFLTYARPNKFVMDTVDLNGILTEIIKLSGENSELSGDHKTIAKLDKTIPQIPGDNDRVKQVFWNILSNAYKAMREPGTVTIKTGTQKPFVFVEIGDTGSGIPEENIPEIFTPFYSVRQGGTGLGLAISQRIMEEHYGKIEVTSEINRGTVFKLLFPSKRNQPKQDEI